MYMLADGNFLTKLVCENTDCLSYIISFLDILTVLFLAYCASFRVTKGVRIVGWVWAAVVIAATIAVVAIHTCMFTLVSALFTALVLMALFGVTFESMGNKHKEEDAKPAEDKPAMPFVCPMATWQCAMAGQGAQQPEVQQAVPETETVQMAETVPATPVTTVVARDEVAADNSEGLSLRESLAMAREVENAHAVINKKYIADYLQAQFADGVECNTRGNYTKTGLPLADTHYAMREDDGKKCFVYVYETDAAVVLLLCITDEYAQSVKQSGKRINKSAFPKSKDTWYSLVVDASYSEADIQTILNDAYNMAK